MKNTVILILTILQTLTAVFAQNSKQNSNWVFGSNAQIEFDSNIINPKTTPFLSIEACAAVSNPVTGELLFYSNGVVIMDKNGNMLLNGDNLKGSETSTQGALILPHPNAEKQYLLFTTPSFIATDKGLYYSIIDMTLNNGLGGVVAGQKNILLYDNVTEGLTYTYNADSTGYWLLAHERLSNTFLSFEITKKGIGTNIKKSNIGRKWGKDINDRGNFMPYVKISPNGKRIAVSNSLDFSTFTGNVEVYSFDNCNGSVTDEIIIKGLPYICYGNSFSSNSNILYITSLEFPSSVYQVNLLAGSEAAINASLTTIYTAPKAPTNQNRANYLAGIQLNDNGKIYIAESAQKFLHCIKNPDELGSNCNFIAEKIKLANGSSSRFTLPQQVPVQLKEPKVILDSIKISINDTCIEKIEKAILIGINNPTAIKWRLINITNRDTIIVNDSINYIFSKMAIGEYILEALVNQDCKNYFASKRFTMFDCDCSGKISISDTCIENAIGLSITSNDVITGVDWRVSDKNGNIILKQKSLNANFKIDSVQIINVTAIVNFTCKSDTFYNTYNLTACPKCSTFFVPNVFTPNNDGLNDEFKFKTNCEIEILKTQIFNRWGSLLFESSLTDNYWDGSFNNIPCSEGVYFYLIEYKLKDLSISNKRGTVTLIK